MHHWSWEPSRSSLRAAAHGPGGDMSSGCAAAPAPSALGFPSPLSALVHPHPQRPSHRSATQHRWMAAAKGEPRASQNYRGDWGNVAGPHTGRKQGQNHAETKAPCSAQGTSISMPWGSVRLSRLLWHIVAGSDTAKCPTPVAGSIAPCRPHCVPLLGPAQPGLPSQHPP